MKTATIINPEQVAAVRSLSLRARLIVEGYITGLHESPYHGFSAEFLEYRPYRPGETVRAIDWRAYGRTDRAVVRVFEDETNLRANLMLDKSASMGFRSAQNGLSKLDYAKTLAAALGWILIRQRDAVGLTVFDEALSYALPPRSTNLQLKTILATLDTLSGSGETRCGAAIEAVANRLTKRGLCVLFSDLLDDPETIARGLRHLRFKRQDVIVLRIIDPMERTFDETAPLRLRDLETGAQRNIDGQTAARFYHSGYRAHENRIADACRELRIDLVTVTTDEPFIVALRRIMEKRRRVG